ncbi:hypothetical protein [Burkholderia anthina]|uniref:hypothetical protein n=1 Tax=Burkholderia anthina TaxID=179879 RepID=UPI001AA0446E|nr:hypothetical protein [Burkholderia anthina]QTD88903.1 hypothetical protein J4G50_13910 [Burkholderia anthina]
MKTIIGVVAMAIATTACTTAAVFRDPVSGQVAQCNSSTPGVFPIIAQHEIDECAATYSKMGWQRQ